MKILFLEPYSNTNHHLIELSKERIVLCYIQGKRSDNYLMIMVSIVCNTFNHEKYIKSALESFINQKTDFQYEILVHDDASTDNTVSIIKEYCKQYPGLIKPIFQEENQYSKGIDINQKYQYPRAKGKYIAICEGDDYWIDEYKLQKQFEALEKQPQYNICTCGCWRDENGVFKGVIAPATEDTVFSVGQVIMGGGAFVGTNSIMLRKDNYLRSKLYGKIIELDYFIQIIGSLSNGMLFLSDNMCAYRVSAEGSWTKRINSNTEKRCIHDEMVIENLMLFDELTENKYNDEVKAMIKKKEYHMLYMKKDYSALLHSPYYDLLKKERLFHKMRIIMFCAIDKVIKGKRKKD